MQRVEKKPDDGKTDAVLATVSGKEDDIENGHISSLDEAELFLREHGISHSQLQEMLDDPAKSRRIRRRVDLILLPLLCGTYALQYIDKQALGYSAVFDLFKDAHINSDEYSWLASIFYFGYLFLEYPANLIAQRLPVGTVISCFVIAWGAILMVTASCNNFTGMAICRFLLGCFEAPITPCFMMIVAMWYLRQEQPFRAGCFYCCNGIGSMLGGLISFAIGQLNGFPVWRAVFLICGGVTVLWGGILLLFLPNSILSAKRFTIEEKILLIGRGKQNQTGILNRSIKWYQIREALVDPQVWLAFLFVLLNETCNGGVANFGKLIIKGLVSSPLLATALGIPQGAFQVFFILSGTYLSSRFKNIRTIIMVIYLLPTVTGVCLLWQLPRTNRYGVLFGYYIIGSYVTSLVLCLQMPSSNTGGYTKRVTATALVFIAYCVGNIVGPHAFLAREAPVYETGCKLILACVLGQMACTVALRVLLGRRNERRDAEGVARPEGDADEQVLADLTDFENPRFRYVL
ncbi:putative MFS transporter [Aspergillus fischeri NRRL 181]|uniref:MFS transporter, putative n=1 Tax=Neosartorya fischeri (strain ATCC 1020 / DSM 3700 / CBS 544.65 / FGSC A1164 / JCM 1740 / NRRL 181 / WB 181) TaxID=331117 RepID=A1D8Z9_NEOFI|nr:MFS transporter, putative [Aspergillus fischeri NRRL 181]EAW20860.1 MFS transporter, putative [Aspergillus fischeri NRRL 181]